MPSDTKVMKKNVYLKLFCLLFFISSFLSSNASAAKLLVLGDSLSAAYGMDINKGWVSLLQQQLNGEYQVINGSISGDTTAGGLSRLPALLAEHEPQFVLIELGGNDGLRGYSIASMKKNLQKLINLSRKQQASPILFSMRIPTNYGKRYTEQFASAFPAVAQQESVPLIPFVFHDIMLNPALMQEDGIHPAEDAQPLIAEKMKEALSPIINGH